jgi:hypothetical protein
MAPPLSLKEFSANLIEQIMTSVSPIFCCNLARNSMSDQVAITERQ